MRIAPALVLVLGGLCSTDAVLSDVLLMDVIAQEPSNSSRGLPRPHRGARMEQVVARFGEPAQRLAAVGEPPITRWVYPEYTVYFEDDRVLTSVVPR